MTMLLDPATVSTPDHATPPCPHFGPCGGCQIQHLPYDVQLAGKAYRLRALLASTGLALPDAQLHPSPPLAYRNRIRLTLAEVHGRLRAGYLTNRQPTTGNRQPAFLAITECPIAATILWRATEALLAELDQRATTWLERAPFTFDQLEMFATADESQLQISLFVRTSASSLPAKFTGELATLCESLRSQIPALIGAGIYLLPPRSPRSRHAELPKPGPTWGPAGLNYAVTPLEPRTPNLEPPLTYWVPRGAFFQVNRFLLPELLALVTDNRSGGLAFDLYAGVGLFSRALAARFHRVTAVEIAGPAAVALAATKLPNLLAVKSTTRDFLRSAVTDRDRPDLIVLDPPRSGAGTEVCALLARINTPTLIYVSCSPESLPADLLTLVHSGYTLAELHLFDLFPQTTHIEAVAILTR